MLSPGTSIARAPILLTGLSVTTVQTFTLTLIKSVIVFLSWFQEVVSFHNVYSSPSLDEKLKFFINCSLFETKSESMSTSGPSVSLWQTK
jgi:hypothetical protein